MEEFIKDEFKALHKRIDEVCKQQETLRCNDLEHLKDKIETIKDNQQQENISIEGIKTDMAWLKKFFWVVASTSVGALVTGFITMLLNYYKE